MQHDLFIAIVAGLGGMIGWGVADFFAKKTIDRLGDVTTLFWNQCLGVIPLTAASLIERSMPPWNGTAVLGTAALGIWSGLSYIPTYIAFGKGKVSLLSPLFACYAIVVTIISAAVFGESIPYGRQMAFVTVFVGVVLITGNVRGLIGATTASREVREVKGLREILLAICLYSLWLIALDRFLIGKPWLPILWGIRLCATFSLFLYATATGRSLRVCDRSLWKYLVLIGCFDVGAFASVAIGFRHTPLVSVVAMLSGAFSLPTILLARTFLKERATTAQTAGSFIVVLGIALLYWL